MAGVMAGPAATAGAALMNSSSGIAEARARTRARLRIPVRITLIPSLVEREPAAGAQHKELVATRGRGRCAGEAWWPPPVRNMREYKEWYLDYAMCPHACSR